MTRHDQPISKDWANKILTDGHETDNRNPSVTYAKVWDKKTGKWNVIELSTTKRKRTILNFKTRFIR